MEKITIRQATIKDVKRLIEIYAPYVTNTAITFEYTVPTLAEFSKRIETTLEKYPYLVAILNNQIVGYAYTSALKNRAAYDWAVETSIYVDWNYKGLGIGKALYLKLEEISKLQHVLNMNACIAYPNPGSIAFHEKLGYQKIAHFHQCGYKLGQWYDMIWMEKMLGEHCLNPEKFIKYAELKMEVEKWDFLVEKKQS